MKHTLIFGAIAFAFSAGAQSTSGFHVTQPSATIGLSQGSGSLIQGLTNEYRSVPTATSNELNIHLTSTSPNHASGIHFQSVPEPSSLIVLGGAALGFVFKRRKQ